MGNFILDPVVALNDAGDTVSMMLESFLSQCDIYDSYLTCILAKLAFAKDLWTQDDFA
jgi:hypothetical protein